MITNLTKNQESQLSVFYEKWLKIGLATGPAHKTNCIKYARIAYQKVGLDPPTQFIFAKSPIDAISKISKITGESGKEILKNQMYGNHDSYWLSSYDFFLNVVGITDCSQIEGLIGIAENCGWWNAYDNFVVFQDRPSSILRNSRGDLHNEDGPALSYSDGFQLWYIDGNRLTEQIVMRPETLTIKQIDDEKNSDIKSIMIDRFGWPRYLKEIQAKVIDFRKNVIENTLESLFETKDFGLRLLVTCPTGRVFVKGIPSNANIKSCEDAQLWLGNDVNKKYNVIGRT